MVNRRHRCRTCSYEGPTASSSREEAGEPVSHGQKGFGRCLGEILMILYTRVQWLMGGLIMLYWWERIPGNKKQRHWALIKAKVLWHFCFKFSSFKELSSVGHEIIYLCFVFILGYRGSKWDTKMVRRVFTCLLCNYFYLFVWASYLHVWLCTTGTPGTHGGHKEDMWSPVTRVYKWLWAAM